LFFSKITLSIKGIFFDKIYQIRRNGGKKVANLGIFNGGQLTVIAAAILLEIGKLEDANNKHIRISNVEQCLIKSGRMDLSEEEVLENVRALARIGFIIHISATVQKGPAKKKIEHITLTPEGEYHIQKINNTKKQPKEIEQRSQFFLPEFSQFDKSEH